MSKPIQGKEVFEALADLKEPVTLDEIVRYVAKTHSQSEDKVRKAVEDILNGGVRFGLVEKHNEFYYRICDMVDSLEDSSEVDEDDVVDSGASVESVQSVDSGDLFSEPQSKKSVEAKAPKSKNHRGGKSKDYCSDEEEDEQYLPLENRTRRRSHRCTSDCTGFHTTRSLDNCRHSRTRSRSATRRR